MWSRVVPAWVRAVRVCGSMCARGGGGGEPWGFFNLHFSNSFLLCAPKRQHAGWNQHLTFAKCWWSGPDRRGGGMFGGNGGSSKPGFELHLFFFFF